MKLKPGEEVYQQIIAIPIICMTILVIGIHFEFRIVPILLICIFVAFVFLRHLIAVGRTIVMDEDGCTISFWRYQKRYKWDDLIVKRIELFRGDSHKYCVYQKMKVAVFASYKIYKYHKNYKKGQWSASDYCMARHPLSFIYVYLVSDGELKKVESEKKLDNYLSYVVEETIFLQKLKDWNVEFEDLTANEAYENT